MGLKLILQIVDNQYVIKMEGFYIFDDDLQTREVLFFIFFV